jgi:hypothetical protein
LIPLSVDFDEALSSLSVIPMLSMPQHGTVDNVTLGSSSRCPFYFILVMALQEEEEEEEQGSCCAMLLVCKLVVRFS